MRIPVVHRLTATTVLYMVITVNGSPRDLPDGSTLHMLIRSLALSEATTVAEVNGEIIPAGRFDDTILNEHDRIELVRFVGGG